MSSTSTVSTGTRVTDETGIWNNWESEFRRNIPQAITSNQTTMYWVKATAEFFKPQITHLFGLLRTTRNSLDWARRTVRRLQGELEEARTALQCERDVMERLIQRQESYGPSSPQRPDSRASVVQARAQWQAELEAMAADLTNTTLMSDRITQRQARELIDSKKAWVDAEGIGCWMAKRNNGKLRTKYYKLNLRNTYAEDGKKLKGSIRIYQLALIADNRREELRMAQSKATGTQYYECSHLCHNAGCFNPKHVVVEPRMENKLRQSCNGRYEIHAKGLKYHPCPHHDGSARQRCILPVDKVESHHVFQAPGMFTRGIEDDVGEEEEDED